jgi:hypothetical protein
VLQLGQVLDLAEGHVLNLLDLAVLKQIEIVPNLGGRKNQTVFMAETICCDFALFRSVPGKFENSTNAD